MESSHFQVPWYSMEEWSLVYRQIYSMNVEDMKKAYRRLLVWKTRMENLPAGVECTLGILQVRLREMETANMRERVLSQEDLQLMYSTAIIRFLNMIAELERGQDEKGYSTLYYKAQGMAIPSWIVNLRHDAAHSTTLPPLHSLKSAADFIFNWLNDHYWKNEAEHTQDYYIDVPNTSRVYPRKIGTILSLLRIYLDLAESESCNVSEIMLDNLNALIPGFNARDKDASLNKIVYEMSNAVEKETKKHDVLELILREANFLDCKTENNKSQDQLLKVWTPIFNILNKQDLLVDFMSLLIAVLSRSQSEEVTCERVTHWVNAISRGFRKLERCLHVQLDLTKRDIGTSLSTKRQFHLVLKVVDRNYPLLKSAMILKGKLPTVVQFRRLLEEAVRVPSQHTLVFLSNLCFISRVATPPLQKLVNLYLNSDTGASLSDSSQLSTVFTVESLKRLSGESHDASGGKVRSDLDKASFGEEFATHVDMESNAWSLANDHDWLHCPLGSAPGDSEEYLNMDLLATQD